MYKFIDAQQMKKENPLTFEAPTLKELNKLKPENFVKICHDNERFWVEVQAIQGDIVTGRIDNDLVLPHPFKYNEIITFEKRNIYNILTK